MTQRGMTAGVQAEAARAQNQPCHLFALYLDGTTVFATDGVRPIQWNGENYVALGHFLAFTPIKETADVRVSEVQVELTGCDQLKTWIASVLNTTFIERRLTIHKAFLSAQGDAMVDPVAIFDGRVSESRISEDPDSGAGSVHLTAASHFVDFERLPGRNTNDAVQQIFFPGDRFFEFTSQIPNNRSKVWGRT